MIPAVETGHDLDEARALELIFEEDAARCDGFGKTCGKEVEYLIICVEGDGHEQVCGKCLKAMRKHAAKNARSAATSVVHVIRFSKSCNHSAFLEDCTVRPV